MKQLPSKLQDYNLVNVENSLNSGQVFLWNKKGNYWYGINGYDVLRISKEGKIKSFKNNKIDFFRKKENMQKIIKSITKDQNTKKAVKQYPGLRILKQDPFQCMISFIVSSNSNIPKIKFCLENLCKKFGEKVEFDNQEFYLFPKPEKLANASITEIQKCGTGYRSKFIKKASKMIVLKKIDFEKLENLEYFELKKEIRRIPGIGNKVADCIMLFSLNKSEAFPLDRWMMRILEKYFANEFKLETKTITEKQYDILHGKIVKYFGAYAGFAQQFLFKMERENSQKKWL